jgi:hypothetical protein
MRSIYLVLPLAIVLSVSLAAAGEAETKAEPAKKAEPVKAPETAKKEEPAISPEPPKKPPHLPLPLHTIEGTSGVFVTDTAYFANLPEKGWLGLPSVGLIGSTMSHGRNLEVATLTTTIFKRVELGFSDMRLGLGSWPRDVQHATGIRPLNSVRMQTYSLRANVIQEGEGGIAWMPAVTIGVRYKYNDDIWRLNRELGGAVRGLGVRSNSGEDYTITATKMIVGVLPRPFIVSAGFRNTDAANLGLFGFTDRRTTVFETSAVFFLTDKLLFATEFRQKPDQLKRLPGLVGPEDNWYTAALAYIVNSHCVVAAGVGNFGNVANHREPCTPAVEVKWEF